MRVVTVGACDAAGIHQALHEIIALHAVLVRGAVWKVGKGEIAQLMVFELPVVLQVFADVKSNRPIIIFPLDWIGERFPCEWHWMQVSVACT